ncbi:MAG: DNA internalization-related competence protein ComEC/Rec2 [candidate division KSB1 bacterium]|nr:DNA internalization-related competence protein ComEC/Rec2 [candidate division KSB1 bacterium]
MTALLSLSLVLFIATTLLVCVKVSWANYFLIVTVMMTGFLRYEIATRIFPSNHIIHLADSQAPFTLSGTVASLPRAKPNCVELIMTVDSVRAPAFSAVAVGKILVRFWRMDISVNHGDRLSITGKLRAPRSERNPGDFDYRKYLAADGIHALVDISRNEQIEQHFEGRARSANHWIQFMKRRFHQTLHQLHAGQPGTLITALLLGERGEVSPELIKAFMRGGVIHALAISGLHIGYIGLIFFTLFSLLRFGYSARIMAVIVSVFGYGFLVGFQPPIFRASLMMALFLIGRLLQRQTDFLNIISMAAIVILLINPQELFQVSFQLSFAAVLSIVYIYQRLKFLLEKSQLFLKFSTTKMGGWIAGLFLVTVSAQIGTLPIVIYYFHLFSISAFFLNLIVIPLVGVTIALGLATLALSLVSISLASFYAQANTLCLSFLMKLIEHAGAIKFAAIETGTISLAAIGFYYLLLWLLLHLEQRCYRRTLIFALLLGIMAFSWQPLIDNGRWLQVMFFDVGQGDAALVRFPDGKNLLIDAGPQSEDIDAGVRFIVPYLKRERIQRLDAVVLSHSDNDHIGGMASVLRNVSVQQMIDNGQFQASSICSTYQFVIDSLRLPQQRGYAFQRLPGLEDRGVFILHPTPRFMATYPDDINNNSIVLKIVYGQRSFLFCGDIGEVAESHLLSYRNALKADVLKVPHHGSQTSSSLAWLQLIRPEYAVISLGRDNKFNFPSPAVVKRLRELGAHIARTDETGAVIFRTNGVRLERIR